jgi:predicted nucleic acid-binding protein
MQKAGLRRPLPIDVHMSAGEHEYVLTRQHGPTGVAQSIFTMVALLLPFHVLIVLDTNVFVGACLGMGPSNAVVAACLRGEHEPLMGAALMAEFEDVLGRAALWEKSRLSAAERSELLDIFLGTCRWTRIYFGWRPNLRDEGDNHLVELAVAGGAQRIVTRNLRDFANTELKFPSLVVMSPTEFLKESGS